MRNNDSVVLNYKKVGNVLMPLEMRIVDGHTDRNKEWFDVFNTLIELDETK